MQNYKETDYAMNVNNENIVYNFADGVRELSLTDFLAENPQMTKADFDYWKEKSDEDYCKRDRQENAQTKKNISYDVFVEYNEDDEINGNILGITESAEDEIIGSIDMREEEKRYQERLNMAKNALSLLTETQRKRFMMYHYKGMTLREIAENEGVHFTSVQESLQSAEKNLEKFRKNIKNTPTKAPFECDI